MLTGAIKAYIDGSLGAGTARLRTPYADSDSAGEWRTDPDALRELVSRLTTRASSSPLTPSVTRPSTRCSRLSSRSTPRTSATASNTPKSSPAIGGATGSVADGRFGPAELRPLGSVGRPVRRTPRRTSRADEPVPRPRGCRRTTGLRERRSHFPADGAQRPLPRRSRASD